MSHGNIAIFVPHLGCPQQCSFCDQRAISGQASLPTAEDVARAAEIGAKSRGFDPANTEIAFFGGSFTAIPANYMLSLLRAGQAAVERFGLKGIRCSTRPDAIDPDIIARLKDYGVTAVELGAQSMDDGVLEANHRGHTARHTQAAAELIGKAGIELGLQMMTGLYTDNNSKALATGEKLIALRPATVRVYPAILLPGTTLARLWRQGRYSPQTLEEAVELCAQLLDRFQQAGVRVIRMGLHAGPGLEARLAGPYHPAFRQLVESRLFLAKLCKALPGPGKFTVGVNPRDISTALGQGRENLPWLEARGFTVRFCQNQAVPRGGFFLESQ